ncbi:acyltransferase [Herbiconiux moechotypicola]|uniref:Acyltransferase 3 domain-containing protein n=1 Tax=Herbiconiux moechotypicola TaxID=637393 RepID=A0ABN3E1B8_9MICO|nr:acyltransferase [Herbiconiux moechotypicola]MCS5731327.1 acyltransferase [Herbiconiux moechotypicola]
MRLASLDGLRGLAAVVVVVGHARLVLLGDPTFVWPVPAELVEAGSAVGGRAVWLFFVLSGLVLTRLAQRSGFEYGPYLLSRLVRLYLPVAAAVAFTIVTMLLVPRTGTGFGPWIDTHPERFRVTDVVADLTLVSGVSGNLSPLWSLQWEVLFSMLLVLYVTVLRRAPWWCAVAAGVVTSAAGAAIGSALLQYLPMFAIGVGLAFGWERLGSAIARFRRVVSGGPATAIAVAALAAAACQPWATGQLLRAGFTPSVVNALAVGADAVASLLAAVVVTLVVGFDPVLQRLFSSPPFLWLGTISFSLYLIHEPVLIAAARLAGPVPLTVGVSLLLCLAVAVVFQRVVEGPAHRLSQGLRRGRIGVNGPD